jgi:NCS1 family nucleobase:cation symporter-1
MTWFYNYGWFTGAFSGAALYYLASTMMSKTVLTGSPEEA